MEGKYIQFPTGDDGVPHLDPVVKVRKKESAVSTLATYISMFYINNS